MADAEIADSGQWDDGSGPGTREGKLTVIKEHLGLAAKRNI